MEPTLAVPDPPGPTVMQTLLLPILLLHIFGWLVWAGSLWLGGLLLKAPKATFLRAVMATFIYSIVGLAILGLILWVRGMFTDDLILAHLLVEGLLLVANLVGVWLTIRSVFATTFGRAILIWLIHLVPALALTVVAVLTFKAFVAEAFVISANSMAPTLLGWHRLDKCPHCQEPLIVPGIDPREPMPFEAPGDVLSICMSCRKAAEVKKPAEEIRRPDRILASRLIRPERWDMVVFRHPTRPDTKYVDRLVGMPGEKVQIKQGAVWINDVKQAPPATLAGLNYVPDVDPFADEEHIEREPIQLGSDQYFVLGDFSLRSSDSRDWGPVPGGNIECVVCAIYWPMERWKVLR